MTPSTPPASRGRRNSRSVCTFEEALQERKDHEFPQTPHRGSHLRAPVTPSTVKPFKHSVPSLKAPLMGNVSKSPFKGFNSPEYTPQTQSSKSKGPLLESAGELQNVSRVLFPPSNEELLSVSDRAPLSLLPPRRPVSTRRDLSDQFSSDLEEGEYQESRKLAKQVPGTPSHKVVTFQMAQEWNNSEHESADDLSDSEEIVKGKSLYNPFQSEEVADESIRQQRKQLLLHENPDIEDVITYVNKKGDVVRRRHLSEREKELYKPKRLFAEELNVLETKRKQDIEEEH